MHSGRVLNLWMETQEEEHDERHMMMTLLGRFKGEADSRWHMVPICNKTRSNIPFHLWMETIMRRRVHCQHCTKGWLFETKTGARAKFEKYDPTFRSSRLVANAIEPDDFSLWRSPRRGAVLKTTQQGVDSTGGGARRQPRARCQICP